jgi:hypothetical protein
MNYLLGYIAMGIQRNEIIVGGISPLSEMCPICPIGIDAYEVYSHVYTLSNIAPTCGTLRIYHRLACIINLCLKKCSICSAMLFILLCIKFLHCSTTL